jgi:hypothetical protein
MNTSFIKISLIIFVFLALLISLFPPFNFGNRVKQYDFLFNGYDKYVRISNKTYPKKFYSKDSIEAYKEKWSDRELQYVKTSSDSFFTTRRFLFFSPKKKRDWFADILYHSKRITENGENDAMSNKVYYDETDLSAINFNEVKTEYNKTPDDWDYKYVDIFIGIKNYNEYNITEPVYLLLERKILLAELLVEYILAVLLSIILGYFIKRFIPEKFLKI